jgi:hypothetical protein
MPLQDVNQEVIANFLLALNGKKRCLAGFWRLSSASKAFNYT